MGPFILQGNDMRGMRTEVRINGRQAHSFDTGNMIFDPATVISEISKYNTLSPGDVVWLGTDDKPHNLKVGDVLEIEITGIGLLRNKVVARRRPDSPLRHAEQAEKEQLREERHDQSLQTKGPDRSWE